MAENIVKDGSGREYRQRKISIGTSKTKPAPPPPNAVKCYNKLRARVYLSEGVLEPESEGMVPIGDIELLKAKGFVVEIK